MKNFKKIQRNKGAAMLISVIFFLFISLAVVFGLVSSGVRELTVADNALSSKQSYFLSESGVEDAYYRLKNTQTIGSSTSITLGGNTATTTITDSGYNQKTISSIGNVSSRDRKVGVVVSAGAGVGFNYGVQSGSGGVTINGGSQIIGSLYSNSSINAVSATVTGSAIAADSPAVSLDQSNTSPATPLNSITFRNAAASADFAQSFQVSSTSPLSSVQFYIKKVGSPANATIRLVADNSGAPSTTVIPIGTISLNSASVTTSYSWVQAVFTSNPSLIPGATYWLVIDNGSTSASSYYVLGANADTSYTNGTADTGVYSGTWNAASLDSYFEIYTGGVTSVIGGASYSTGFMVGTGGTGDVWASNVQGTSAQGHMYCATGSNNNKACDTSHGSVPSTNLPFTTANIADWKNTASAGGIITGATNCPGGSSGGNCTVNSSSATFGPGKITGNLTVNGGGTLTLTGTLWVVGTVTVTGGGKIKLPTSYGKNSETIISDSTITIAGGGSVGSGNSNSFLFFVSTSRCPYDTYCSGNSAITVSGGAGAIAVNAQSGDVLINGGASLDAISANSITITGGGDVNYNSGLASPSFSDGPSGGWNISSWGETE